jgi:hypothetical protein
MENALVHRVGDVATLTEHVSLLDRDRALLEKLRLASLSTISEITWPAAGLKLLQVYKAILDSRRQTMWAEPSGAIADHMISVVTSKN